MKNYKKEVKDNKIIFKNILDNSELSVIHYDNENVFDTIYIDDTYDLDFIKYVVIELKRTKDISVLFSLSDSLDLENKLLEESFKVSNYQYSIKFINQFYKCDFCISEKIDSNAKKYYLKIINDIYKKNHEYFGFVQNCVEIDENWFSNKEFVHRIYKKNGKILGIVDYGIVQKTSMCNQMDCNDKIYIRCVLSDDINVVEAMLKDLLSVYKKDIIVSVTYMENKLQNVIKKMNGEFNFCQYILIDMIKNTNY